MLTPRNVSVFLIVSIFSQCQAARILTISPVMSKSHHILGSKLSIALAEDGHDVTLISSFKDGYTPKKGSYREIELTGFVEQMSAMSKDINFFTMGKMSPFIMVPIFLNMNLNFTETILSHPNVQELIHSNEKFDVVLMEQFGDDAVKALAPYFGAHLVIYSAAGQSYWINSFSGTPSLPSYDPEFLLGYTANMSFYERLQNTLVNMMFTLGSHLYSYPRQSKLVYKYISPDINLYDVMYNNSLIFVNTHASVSPALPRVPNMIFIGGFHIEEPKPLPKDLKQLLDTSKEGVVLFSMGSVLRSKDLPEEKRNALLKVLGKLKQTVLWKYENDTLPGIPKNVKIMKWLPQADLLAHPNLKLFITHCGYGSTAEIIYHGTPTIAMPVFGDQYFNAKAIEDFGISLSLPFPDFTEEKLSLLISEVLDNPSYAENGKRISSIYKDRQVKPIDEVLYWIDYILKHNGAAHLRSVTLGLPWYQLYLLDVAAFFLVVTLGSIFVIKKVCCCCKSWKICCDKKQKKKDTKEKKQ